MEVNLNDLLRQYRSHPYEDNHVETPHTGVVTFAVEDGQEVEGPSGKWLHRPGTTLFTLEREGNRKKIHAHCSGFVANLRSELNGRFVEAGEPLLSIRHRLSRDEIIDKILTQVLHLFPAPERARYLLTPEAFTKLEKQAAVSVTQGDEIIIMSLMKRDTFIPYEGVPGTVYKVYFKQGDMVEQGAPLLGICPPEKLPYVEKVIQRVRSEWEE